MGRTQCMETQSMQRTVRKEIRLHHLPSFHTPLFILGLCLLIMFSLSCSSVRRVNWLHIVPDGYEGYLVVRYYCPQGTPLIIKDNTVEVYYQDDGTFCTSDDPFGWQGKVFARSRSGEAISTSVMQQAGYGFRGEGIMSISTYGSPVYKFEVSWVGYLEKRDVRPRPYTPVYNLQAFLEDRYKLRFPPESK